MAGQNGQQVQSAPMTLDKQVAVLSSKTTQWITDNIKNPNMAIAVPKGYNVGNEVSSLIFAISQVRDKDNRSVLEVTDPAQIMNEVRDCVVQGLSVKRKHVWPIIYGGRLTLQMSYFGLVAALSYMFPDLQVYANVLYEGDEYDYCTDEVAGYNYITNVRSSIANRDRQIIGAYGNIVDKTTGRRIYGIVMSWQEIQKNWSKSRGKDNSVQRDFPQEMAKRTVISRMCKMFVNSGANTNTEQVSAFNRMTEAEFVDVTPKAEAPAGEAERQAMLHSRSRGSEGLRSMLRAEERPVEKPADKPAEKEAVKPKAEPKAETSGIRPSVRRDKWGNVVPNDDGDDDLPPMDEETGELFGSELDTAPF